MLELNKLDKKVSFDKFSKLSKQDFNQGNKNELDKSVESAFSYEKIIDNGDYFYISDSSEMGFKDKIKKNNNVLSSGI